MEGLVGLLRVCGGSGFHWGESYVLGFCSLVSSSSSLSALGRGD